MNLFEVRPLAFAMGLLLASCVAAADDSGDTLAQVTPVQTIPLVPPAAPQSIEKTLVVGAVKKLDQARNGLSPDTGSTTYRFDQKDISALPLGDSTPLNQVILRAPGVAQDSFGQVFVRGDHANLQYRINGVIIPEAITGFGQTLDTRFANEINVLMGALPAQYGYRTAGVIDITTKGTEFRNGGSIGFLGGSHGHREGVYLVTG